MGNVIKKSLVGIVIGGILFGATNALGFPFVFQVLFFGYAMLGAVVFIILDLPPLKPISGVKAAGALVVFYAILSVAYIAGGAVWPQFDPEDEKRQDRQDLEAEARTLRGRQSRGSVAARQGAR